MNIIETIKEKLENEGIENVFITVNPIVDRKFLEDNYSIEVSGEKYFNLWIIEYKNISENLFSVNSNICSFNVIIKGYFGINNTKYSAEKFKMIIEKIEQIICSGNILELTGVAVDNIEQKISKQILFCNILCHYHEFNLSVNYLKSIKG